ncbi:MAG: nucleotidyltransferase domain-containing protein, partial [Roseburia sp.]
MNQVNQTIVDVIIKKAEKVCPQSLALIAVYGSVATGDDYEKSDLDLMILINDDEGWKLSAGFILDDIGVGYDIYCTSWQMIEGDAECSHSRLSKLMDSKILYVKDESAVKRLDALREKAANLLQSEERFEKAEEALKNAKIAYADAMLSESLSETRAQAAYVIELLLDTVMLWNGRYFKKGVKRTFEELEEVTLPEHFVSGIEAVVMSKDIREIRDALTDLMAAVKRFAVRAEAKSEPSQENIAGT